MADLVVSGWVLRLRHGWRRACRRRQPSRSGVVVLPLVPWGALDDITTGTEPDHTLEWGFVALVSVALFSSPAYAVGAFVLSAFALLGFLTDRSSENDGPAGGRV